MGKGSMLSYTLTRGERQTLQQEGCRQWRHTAVRCLLARTDWPMSFMSYPLSLVAAAAMSCTASSGDPGS